jgi:predicted glycogen debranching enzyme
LFAVKGSPITALSWRLRGSRPGVTLHVRPLLSGRDYHSTHHENGAFRFDADVTGERVTWHPYDGLPPVSAVSNGRYSPGPDWYRNFQYEEERARGLDDVEDLASPGVFAWNLSSPAVMMLTTDPEMLPSDLPLTAFHTLREAERTRRTFPSALHRAADSYLVRRGSGKTIVAGYPWFTDWGRDTFVALRGLCIASGRLDDARRILVEWAGAVSDGMLPNRFPDRGEAAEFNSVDASLWYVLAVNDCLARADADGHVLPAGDRDVLRAAVEAIVSGYAAGTRYGIRMDVDGLLACGVPGVQLTWMDAKIGDWVVTPRVGKPVEIQALWLNALSIASRWSGRWKAPFEIGLEAFRSRFWNAADEALFDVVDVDHVPGKVDASIRPNQILAVGGLPLMLLEKDIALRVLNTVESRLLTPMGLRSLAPGSPGYAPRYEGNGAERDSKYHQGTVWPWLLGPFVEAWIRVHGATAANKRTARQRFLAPLLELAGRAGGQLPEIADAEPPHPPRGCPAQAWSVGEVLRMELEVLSTRRRRAVNRVRRAAAVTI